MAETKKAEFKGDRIIEEIRLLIRYDIPVLLVGKSSIGKSFTMIAIANKFKMPNQLLYVGSEKSEHIEGLPRLTSLREGTETLEYLKPYWFPKGDVITKMVTNGRDLFARFAASNFNPNTELGAFNYTYKTLSKLLQLFGEQKFAPTENTKTITLKENGELKNIVEDQTDIIYASDFVVSRDDMKKMGEEILEKYYKDDLRDICVYLCTLLGYGNFWLMLEEIDKVEEGDTDKFAPLLHIVRERWLKKWKLREINEGEGIDIVKMVSNSDYTKIKNMIDTNIALGQSLLDTRVIAISNKTENLEEALFRRFCQVIITDLLLLDPIDPEKGQIKFCIDDKLKQSGVGMDFTGLELQKIEEVNLQWSLNFFNRMLNKKDLQGNFIITDYRTIMGQAAIRQNIDKNKNPNAYKQMKSVVGKETILYKILTDNFDDESENGIMLINNLFDCLSSQIETSSENKEKSQLEQVEAHIIEMSSKKKSEEDMKFEILDLLEDTYPKGISDDKISDVEKWIDLGLAYLSYTMFDKKQNFMQMPLSQYLIPSIQKMFYKKLTQDTTLNKDHISGRMEQISEFWRGVVETGGVDVKKIKTNVDEVQTALYGSTIPEMKKQDDATKIKNSEDSIFGSGEYMSNAIDTSKAYKKSLSFAISKKQAEDMIQVFKDYTKKYKQADGSMKAGTPVLKMNPNFDSFIKYAKENNVLWIKNAITNLKKSGKPDAIDMANEIEKLIS